MAYQLPDLAISSDELAQRIEKLINTDGRRLRRLWNYYRNPLAVTGVSSDDGGSGRPYRQAQEWGLPSRITGVRSGSDGNILDLVEGVRRKEVVIENDIGWRVDTMIDYLFGKSIVINSAAPDPQRRETIGQLLELILASSGGVLLFQQLALLGSVYGFVDVLVKFQSNDIKPSAGDATSAATESAPREPSGAAAQLDDATTRAASEHSPEPPLAEIARMVRLEIVEPARALPLLSPRDYRVVEGYVQCYTIKGPPKNGVIARFLSRMSAPRVCENDRILVTEILTANAWQRYEDEKLVDQGANTLGRLPLVHIQNTALPFEYSGVSDVEPLLPLQDELNTRLSDRASRITLQSFKMYLGKGIEGFTDMPVAPGRMWMTDNNDADVIEFGGDASSPSEDAHISDLREAMDKVSAVTPIAAGAVKGRIGNLTSAAALRVTLQALLAKTEKKRTTYGAAIEQICELALAWLDHAGLFPTTPDERRVEINWPSPLPENALEKLQEAETKKRIGVDPQIVLRELGY